MTDTTGVQADDVTFTAGVRETTEGPVYTVSGQDWDSLTAEIVGNERVVVNMGPPVSYTNLTLPTTCNLCRSRWWAWG